MTNTSQRKLRAHENDLKVSRYVCRESSHGLMLCRRREVCGERAVPPRGGRMGAMISELKKAWSYTYDGITFGEK
jgi:hypothetical protein